MPWSGDEPTVYRSSDGSYAGLLGTTDLETIFAGLPDLLRKDPANLGGATKETVQHVTRVCTKLGVRATLNLAVTDGEEMAFVCYFTEGLGNSLYFVEDGQAFPQGVVAPYKGRSRRKETRHLWAQANPMSVSRCHAHHQHHRQNTGYGGQQHDALH